MKKTALFILLAVALFVPTLTQAAMSFDEALAALKNYTVGSDFSACQRIIDEINAAKTDGVAQAAIAAKLAAALQGSNYDTQKFLCAQLYVVGTEKEVPAIAPLLLDEKLSISARTALEIIPGAKVDEALLDALGRSDGAICAGILDTLGERRNASNVARIVPYLKNTEVNIARCAAGALGKIGDPAALDALVAALHKAKQKVRPAIVNGVFLAADQIAAAGDTARARAAYEKLYAITEESHVRAAALRGMAKLNDGRSGELLVEALKSMDSDLHAVALALARSLKSDEVTSTLCKALPDFEPYMQAMLLDALADRGDVSALEAVTLLLKSADAPVRFNAMGAVGALGNAGNVAGMAAYLGGTPEEEAAAARAALAALRGDGVDQAVIGLFASASPDVKIKLMGVLADRGARTAVPVLLAAALSKDETVEVRKEAFRTLASCVGPDDVPALLDATAKSLPDSVEEAERGAVAALRRLGTTVNAAPMLAAKTKGLFGDKEVKVLFMRVMGAVAYPESLPVLRKAARAMNPLIRKAAIDALANWPTSETLGDLRAIAKKGKSPEDSDVAFAGVLRQLKLVPVSAPSDTLTVYSEMLALAKTPEQTKRVLSGVGEVADRGAIQLLAPYLVQDAFKAEAEAAAEKIRKKFYKASASENAGQASSMIDGDMNSRWRATTKQKPEQWIQIDLGEKNRVKGVVLDTSRTTSDYPHGYAVCVFDDPANPGASVASGTGDKPVIEIAFTPVEGRHVRVTQTGTADAYWSVHELRILAD